MVRLKAAFSLALLKLSVMYYVKVNITKTSQEDLPIRSVRES